MENIIKARMRELEKKRDKYNQEYQNGGSPSALKTYEKYDDLVEICCIALRGHSEEDEVKMRISKNMSAFIKNFEDGSRFSPGKTYTATEVLELLNRMKRLV